MGSVYLCRDVGEELPAQIGQQGLCVLLHCQSFAQQKRLLLRFPSEELLEHLCGIQGAAWSQDAFPVVQTHLSGREWESGKFTFTVLTWIDT